MVMMLIVRQLSIVIYDLAPRLEEAGDVVLAIDGGRCGTALLVLHGGLAGLLELLDELLHWYWRVVLLWDFLYLFVAVALLLLIAISIAWLLMVSIAVVWLLLTAIAIARLLMISIAIALLLRIAIADAWLLMVTIAVA